MANNRLYIVNPNTGALLYFARSNAPRGWTLVPMHDELVDFLADAETGDGIEDTDSPSVLKLVDDHTADAWQEHIANAARSGSNERIERIRQLAELIFADARTLDDVAAASDAIEIELMHATLHRESAIRDAQQETSRLSTAPASSDASCERRGNELAPRSGALEPEETTDGRKRSDL